MKSIFKIINIPLFLAILGLSFLSYLAWEESSFQSSLIMKALEGNDAAINILIKYHNKLRSNQKISEEAIKGNPHALRILEIK